MEEWAGKQAREDEVVLTAEVDTEEVRDVSEVKATDGAVRAEVKTADSLHPIGAEANVAMKAASPVVDVSQRESRLHLSGKLTSTAEQGAPGSVIGPAEAAPHWREFYGAVRAAVQGMRGGE